MKIQDIRKMADMDSVASAFVVLAAVLFAPAIVMPKWGITSILGGGDLGIWQLYQCTYLVPTDSSWIALKAFSVISLLAIILALSAMVAHVTIVGPKKRKASIRTFTGAAYCSVFASCVMIIIFASMETSANSMLSYSFGLSILGTVLMFSAAILGTYKSL